MTVSGAPDGRIRVRVDKARDTSREFGLSLSAAVEVKGLSSEILQLADEHLPKPDILLDKINSLPLPGDWIRQAMRDVGLGSSIEARLVEFLAGKLSPSEFAETVTDLIGNQLAEIIEEDYQSAGGMLNLVGDVAASSASALLAQLGERLALPHNLLSALRNELEQPLTDSIGEFQATLQG